MIVGIRGNWPSLWFVPWSAATASAFQVFARSKGITALELNFVDRPTTQIRYVSTLHKLNKSARSTRTLILVTEWIQLPPSISFSPFSWCQFVQAQVPSQRVISPIQLRWMWWQRLHSIAHSRPVLYLFLGFSVDLCALFLNAYYNCMAVRRNRKALTAASQRWMTETLSSSCWDGSSMTW